MRIAIDARGINWYKGTGIGTYTENILKYMLMIDKENSYDVYWSGENYSDFNNKNVKIHLTSKKHNKFFEQFFIPASISREKADLYHIPQNGMGLCENISCKKIVTIHDIIPYIMPDTVGRGYLIKFIREMPKIIALADAIITVSEFSKKDILRIFPIDPSKIYVTHLAAESRYRPLNKEGCKKYLKKNYGMEKPFILYIGGFSARKNIKSLIIAFSKIQKDLNNDYELVIVGSNKDQGKFLQDFAKTLNLENNIRFTGFVPENDLPLFYNACSAFLYPSLYEGFGLPPLEAMSCGAPTITSNLTSIPEIVGDGAELIDPLNIESIMSSMVKVLNHPDIQNYLSIKGLKRACQFSWVKTSEETLSIYKKVIET